MKMKNYLLSIPKDPAGKFSSIDSDSFANTHEYDDYQTYLAMKKYHNISGVERVFQDEANRIRNEFISESNKSTEQPVVLGEPSTLEAPAPKIEPIIDVTSVPGSSSLPVPGPSTLPVSGPSSLPAPVPPPSLPVPGPSSLPVPDSVKPAPSFPVCIFIKEGAVPCTKRCVPFSFYCVSRKFCITFPVNFIIDFAPISNRHSL